jgi:hypothetical protein
MRTGRRGRDDGRNVTNIQYKSNWNCHYEFLPYNEYILIKVILKVKIILKIQQKQKRKEK